MSRMNPKHLFEVVIGGKLALAVNDYLNSDWSRTQSLVALHRTLFDAWADSVELPCGRVFRKRGSGDGIYVLQDVEGWIVMRQEGGIPMAEMRMYATYKEAKREALKRGLWETLAVQEVKK